MTTATFLRDPMGLAENVSRYIEIDEVEKRSGNEIHAAILVCDFLRNLFALTHQSLETELRQGVDATAFGAKCAEMIMQLDTIRKAVERGVAKTPMTQEFASTYQAFADDMTKLRQFLSQTLSIAKTPSGPLDWSRVQQAEAAYQRGETRPFQRSPKKHVG